MASKVVGSMDEEVAAFVMRHNPGLEVGDMYSAIGNVDATGNIIGGVVFNNFTRRDIHLHVAGVGRHWISRRFIGEVFRYVFLGLGCRRCTGIVAVSNEKAWTLDQQLGFVHEGTLRSYSETGEDCFVLGMLREECRWLRVGELNHGKRRSILEPAAADATGLPRGASPAIPLRRRAS